MPMFLIERNFAEELEGSLDGADQIRHINDQTGVRWLYSFLSADRKKTLCLYEAPSADLIKEAARKAGLPADAIIEIGSEIHPTGAITGFDSGRYE